MTGQSLALATFVTARLDDAERKAKQALDVEGEHGWYLVARAAVADPAWSEKYGRAFEHIDEQDPGRTLLEVVSGRQMLVLLRSQYTPPYVERLGLQLMALKWGDHEDYQPEWAMEL